MVAWLILAVPWVCLRFVVVVFSDHTHFCMALLDHFALLVKDLFYWG